MQFPPVSHHFTPLRSKYSPEHNDLIHPKLCLLRLLPKAFKMLLHVKLFKNVLPLNDRKRSPFPMTCLYKNTSYY
jgi:hypothetical protein